MKLYELEDQYLKISSLINGEDEELLNDTLDSLDFTSNLNDKLVGYGKVVLNVKSDIDTLRSEEKRLSERRKKLENKVLKLEARMLDAMELTKVNKISDSILTINLRKNKRVSILSEDMLSGIYKVEQAPKISKAAIRSDLLEGKQVDGAELTEYTSLTIK